MFTFSSWVFLPCLCRWAVTNRQRLLDLNSSLEFKLHRLYFISLLSGGISNQMEALQYARHFQPFASQHQRGKHSPCNKNLDIFFFFLCVCIFTTFIYSFLQTSRFWWAAWCTCVMALKTHRTAACWRQISGLRSATSSPGTPALCWASL